MFGIVLVDQPFARYLEFPPLTQYTRHAPFNWVVFLMLFLVVGAVGLLILNRLLGHKTAQSSPALERKPFPWWGWLGFFWVLLFWVLAWNRFAFFQFLQRYTFFPLWIGYILVCTGLTWRRTGSCLPVRRPLFFLSLFPASALFWWYFEYLNRFVQNWYYLGNGNISIAEYIIHASLCFSTVLPAVLSTNEYLGTFPRMRGAFAHWQPVKLHKKSLYGRLLIAGAVLSLAFLAVYPNYLFPVVWISPLLVIVGMQLATGRPSLLDGLEAGNWQSVIQPALAALLCGFFWELWNWKSLAQWEYSIPFVHRFQVFAMPLLGYAGYLPFGLECVAVAALLAPRGCSDSNPGPGKTRNRRVVPAG